MNELEEKVAEIKFILCSAINGDIPSCKRSYCEICNFKIPGLDEGIKQIIPLVRASLAQEIEVLMNGSTHFGKVCKSNRKNNAKICMECPFLEIVKGE